jgi:hypothetical protein
MLLLMTHRQLGFEFTQIEVIGEGGLSRKGSSTMPMSGRLPRSYFEIRYRCDSGRTSVAMIYCILAAHSMQCGGARGGARKGEVFEARRECQCARTIIFHSTSILSTILGSFSCNSPSIQEIIAPSAMFLRLQASIFKDHPSIAEHLNLRRCDWT